MARCIDHFLDAPAVRRHLERELRVRQAVDFALEPRLGHLEMRDEPLAIAGGHRPGERRSVDRDRQRDTKKGNVFMARHLTGNGQVVNQFGMSARRTGVEPPHVERLSNVRGVVTLRRPDRLARARTSRTRSARARTSASLRPRLHSCCSSTACRGPRASPFRSAARCG